MLARPRRRKRKGEYSAIFCDTTCFSASASGTFLLSLTPEILEAKVGMLIVDCYQGLAYRSEKPCQFRSIQYPFRPYGKNSEKESARLLLQKVREIAGTTPVVVTGDFNAEPWDEPSRLSLTRLILCICRTVSHYPSPRITAPPAVFNNFSPAETSQHPIDYIFLHGPWKVLNHANISKPGMADTPDYFAVMSTLVPAN